MENAEIAAIFDEIADLTELLKGNEFRVRSYRSAARTIRDLSQRLEDLVDQNRNLTELPNIGESTAGRIREIVATGTCQRLEELRQQLPSGVALLMRVPGLGPRKAMQIYQELGVNDLAGLKKACEEHRVRDIAGMGPKTEEKILKGLRVLEVTVGRVLVHIAQRHVASLGEHLKRLDSVTRWEVAGSWRRRLETIGDLDVLVEANNREKAAEQILSWRAIDEVLARGAEKISVRLGGGFQVDLRFVDSESFGAALVYFTGSQAHNIALRRRAQSRGWMLNEYGLMHGEERLAGGDEESVYRKLDLAWIPPELREDRGEIEAAERGELPDLIRVGDLRGDLQSHTNVTDGSASIEEMAEAARARGFEYFAITDHSKRVTMARGLNDDQLRRHAENIRRVAERYDDFWLMAGVEVDVLRNGELDLDVKVLAEMDWVVASMHYDHDLDEVRMTDRLIAAISSGVVHVVGHPLNRMMGKRTGIPLDFDRVFEACVAHDVRLEINAQPHRLDLPDIHVKRAREAGVGFTIGSDAHKPAELDVLPYGVYVARRGWLSRGDVLNALPLAEFERRVRLR